MLTFELSYEFPLGSGKISKRDVLAETVEQALGLAGVKNPTLTAIEVERNPIASYLKTGDGQQFVSLLHQYENTMYAKVRNPDTFFVHYERATGEKISRNTPGILISEQEDKWGDELSIRFMLNDFQPNFPAGAKPRFYDGGKGILNDNDYVWFLIEQHGFRFGKSSIQETE
jgi:hypothetical protein